MLCMGIKQRGVWIVEWLILSKYNTHKSQKQVFIKYPYGYAFKFQDFMSVMFNYLGFTH